MTSSLTDRIRAYVVDKYVVPARRQGKTQISVRVRDVKDAMAVHEPMRGKSVVICQALQGGKFTAQNQLAIEEIEGPPSKLSPTVVMHYKLLGGTADPVEQNLTANPETPEQWATRLTGRIRGLLKEEMALFGGGDAFLSWVRSEECER